jgi:hypothetical protein
MTALGKGVNPFDINNSIVICGTQVTGSSLDAFRWTPFGGIELLGFSPEGLKMDEAEAINEVGQICGTCTSGYAGLWDPVLGVRALPKLAGMTGNDWMRAYDLNDDAIIVGYAGGMSGNPNGEVAFIWDEANGTRRIDELLDASSKTIFSPPILNRARGVNNNGQILATAYLKGAYLLVPVTLGDMNCDGLVTQADLPAFLEAMKAYGPGPNPPVYRIEPVCGWWMGDMNQDATLDEVDLELFLELLMKKPPAVADP